MIRGSVFVVAGLVVALAACTNRPMGPLAAETVDVDVRVQPTGVADVTEALTIRFEGGPGGTFERRIRFDRADSVSFVSAGLDGRNIVPNEPGETRIVMSEGRELLVRWVFPPSTEPTHAFTLTYRAQGAVLVRGARGSLRLGVIPDRRAYAIGLGRIALTIPGTEHLFDGSGIAEAGWDVARRPNGIVGTRRAIAAQGAGTLVAETSVDRAIVIQPTWQTNEDWSQELMPAFVSGGIFILVVGIGILWIIRFQYPRRLTSGPEDIAERAVVRAGLRTGGLVTIALAAGTAVATWLTIGHLSGWPMAIPLSVLIVGVVFVGVSRRFV